MGLCLAMADTSFPRAHHRACNPASWLGLFPWCLRSWPESMPPTDLLCPCAMHPVWGSDIPKSGRLSASLSGSLTLQSWGLTLLTSFSRVSLFTLSLTDPLSFILSFFPSLTFFLPFEKILIPVWHISKANTQLIVSRTGKVWEKARDEKCSDRSSSKLSGLPTEMRPIKEKTSFGWKAHHWIRLEEEHTVMLNPKGPLFASRPWFHL